MRNFYVLSNARIKREQNTVWVENTEGKKSPLPVENVDSLYLYGEVDLNTRFLNFLSQKRIALHVFNYYGFYAGSYYPREYLHSGFLLVHQVAHYSDGERRKTLARELVRASAHSLLRNLSYYERRKDGGKEDDAKAEIGGTATPLADAPDEETRRAAEAAVDAGLIAPVLADDEALPDDLLGVASEDISDWEAAANTEEEDTEESEEAEGAVARQTLSLAHLRTSIEGLAALAAVRDENGAYRIGDINALRGVEGKMRLLYYKAWAHILKDGWEFNRRTRRPPTNEINALVSFGNSHLYTICLSEIYRTQLTPTISYLHEPGARRFSLALDLSEIFKPLIVDRAIFRLINTGQLKPAHFDKETNACFLNEKGRRLFVEALEERLGATIRHRRLGRSVSYRHLIRLECYKLIRHLTGVETYRAFRAWW